MKILGQCSGWGTICWCAFGVDIFKRQVLEIVTEIRRMKKKKTNNSVTSFATPQIPKQNVNQSIQLIQFSRYHVLPLFPVRPKGALSFLFCTFFAFCLPCAHSVHIWYLRLCSPCLPLAASCGYRVEWACLGVEAWAGLGKRWLSQCLD